MGNTKNEKIAVIDIGTNSILLLITDIKGNDIVPIIDKAKIAKLGEGLIETNEISESAFNRAFLILDEYKKIIEQFDVKNVNVIGTMVLRNAKNGTAFIDKVREKFGFNIEIIDGKKEAYYTFLSIKYDNKIKFDDFIVIDIGGGSTEFVICNNNKINDIKSLDIGAVVIKDRFLLNDPPEYNEITDAKNYIFAMINSNIRKWKLPIIGNGGTITTLAAVKLQLKEYNSELVHGHELTIEDIKKLSDLFMNMDSAKRREIIGLEPKRADIILWGTLILQVILEFFDRGSIIVSDKGVRYGVIYERLYKGV